MHLCVRCDWVSLCKPLRYAVGYEHPTAAHTAEMCAGYHRLCIAIGNWKLANVVPFGMLSLQLKLNLEELLSPLRAERPCQELEGIVLLCTGAALPRVVCAVLGTTV